MLSINNVSDDLLTMYGYYACILAAQTVLMSFLTGQARLRNKAFANREDALRHGDEKYCKEHPEVERIRRIHRNDLENIPTFLCVSALYMLTGPSVFWFGWIMRCYSISRMVYTAAYLNAWRAPLRSVTYCVGMYFILVPTLMTLFYNSLW